MSIVSQPIPNLLNGVSQQAAPQRHPSQCELMENAYPSLASGLGKRPPTQHMAKLRNSTASDAAVHIINRDTTERYVVVVLNGDLEVYDLATGTAKTVTFPDGKTYLNCTTPRTDFGLVTVADYTFIVNRTKVAAMTSATSSATLTGTKQKFSDLPAPTASGAVYKIAGDPGNFFDDYYVKDVTGPVWQETIAPSTTYQIDATTMPHKLVRNGDDTFTFAKATWADRLVGDNTSNPLPSFIGKTIADIFFYRNRLGLVSDENLILTRTAEYFTFWRETVTADLDSDPIDTSASTNKVSILRHAVPFNKVLLTFSDQTQFQFTSGDVLTRKTAKADVVTEFESARECRPVGSGQELFFAVNRGSFAGIREYYVEQDTISNDAADITAHVPSYIPSGAYRLAVSTNEDVLLVLSLNERSALYAYKFYWGADEKVQSSWGRWVFPSSDTILDVAFIDTYLYMVVQRSDGIYLEKMSVQQNATDPVGFLVHLDRRCALTGSYNAVNDVTTWTLPYSDSADMAVVLGEGFGNSQGVSLTSVTRPSSTTVAAPGDHSAAACYVGRKYTMRYRFSELYIRDDKGQGITSAILKLSRMEVSYAKTGFFRIEVTPPGRETYSYVFTGKVTGLLSTLIGRPGLQSGTFGFPVLSGNLGTTIDIVNDSHLPCFFQGAEWMGELSLKARRL